MHKLQNQFELEAPVSDVFDFYCHPENVVRMAPPELNLKIVQADRPLRAGARVLFSTRLRMMPVEVHWLMEVKEFVPDQAFVDRLLKGPFTSWEHSHLFEALSPNRTRITDTIEFGAPNPLLDRLMGMGYIRHKLEETFQRWESILRRELEGRTPAVER